MSTRLDMLTRLETQTQDLFQPFHPHKFFPLACFLVQRLEHLSFQNRKVYNILFWDIPEYRFLKKKKNLDTKTRKCSNTINIFLAALRDESFKKFTPTRKERGELIASWRTVTQATVLSLIKYCFGLKNRRKWNFSLKPMKTRLHKCFWNMCFNFVEKEFLRIYAQSWATITWRKINIFLLVEVSNPCERRKLQDSIIHNHSMHSSQCCGNLR